jgi:hypothetical protein
MSTAAASKGFRHPYISYDDAKACIKELEKTSDLGAKISFFKELSSKVMSMGDLRFLLPREN